MTRTVKYYIEEHELGYRRIKAEGKLAWNEIHGEPGFNFSLRPFLEEVLPKLEFPAPKPMALEIGCGTGPGACFLAERGYRVRGIDIDPLAVEMAAEFAAERNLSIQYEVQDACNLPAGGEEYDLIVDSYCLQCIVTDADREKLFSNVRSRLKPNSFYIIGTAIYREDREYDEDSIFDKETYVEYTKLESSPLLFEDAVRIGNTWFVPHRRHLKPDTLREELESYGFKVLVQEGGELVCSLSFLRYE